MSAEWPRPKRASSILADQFDDHKLLLAVRGKRLGGELPLPPRLDLRERQLPWAPFSILVAGQMHKSQQSAGVVGAACLKGASVSIGLVIRKAAIAVRPAALRPNAGVVGGHVGPGAQVNRGRPVAARKRDVIGGGSRCPLWRPVSLRPPRPKPLQMCARASAQQQFSKISRSNAANALVAMRCFE